MKTNIILAAADYRRSRALWLAARKSGLGASDTAAVLGLDPWRSPLDVYLDKISPDVREESAGEAAEWGSAIEAVVARKVGSRHPELGRVTPTPGICQHPDYDWMRATPDRLLVDRTTGAEALLEIKTTDGRNKALWADGPPHRVQVQVQQQLAVTGLSVAYVAVLFGGREMPDPYRIDVDTKAVELIIEHGGRFWREHVEARNPPEPRIGDDANLAELYPGDEQSPPLVADDSLAALIEQRRTAHSNAREAATAVDALDLQIKEAMGDTITVIDDLGNVLATWKPQNTTRLDSRKLKAEHPDLAQQYSTTTTTRTFRLKETNK